ncbi:MAG: insulinase family protein [bacterium]|nr:insulinase family protein [bacterium]
MNYQKYDMTSYNLHLINTNKFKQIRVSVRFRTAIKKEEITIRNFLQNILINSSFDYKTTRKLVKQSENLYDLKVSSKTQRVGNCSILSFDMAFLNEKLTEDGMLEASLLFFFGLLFKPNASSSSFDKDTFIKVKKALAHNIMTYKDNKRLYSILMMLEKMGDLPFSYNSYGYLDDLNSIDEKTLYQYYLNVLKNDVVDVFVIGEFDNDVVKNIFRENFLLKTLKRNEPSVIVKGKVSGKKVNIIKEQVSGNQSNLSIGCTLSNVSDIERKYVARIFNEIFGGYNSLLFDIVREQNSLAYSIYSDVHVYDSVLIIYAGIDAANLDKTIKLIKKILADMEKGKFDSKLLDQAKMSILSSLDSLFDNPYSIINDYYAKILVGASDIDEKRQMYNAVTKEDVTRFAKKVKIDTVFLLEGVEEDERD